MSGKKKTKYDWSKYNKELVNRGKRLANRIKTIKRDVVEFWDEELERMNEGKEGARFQYPNSMIVFFSIIRTAFNVNSYRNLQGLGVLFFDTVPDYTVINRRIRRLNLDTLKKINREVTRAKTKGRVINVSLDGTGVQVNGKYVWNEKKHNGEKMRKRDWKKINIAIDVETRQIVGIKILGRNENEGSHENTMDLMGDVFENIDNTTKIGKVYADGGYDSYNNFEMFEELGVEPVIRIQERSREIANFMNNTHVKESKRIKYFSEKRSREAVKQYHWKYYVEEYEYGKRSGIEGVIGSFKRFFREKLFSRIDDMIEREILTRVLIWNTIV
jgi:hypothetical protein